MRGTPSWVVRGSSSACHPPENAWRARAPPPGRRRRVNVPRDDGLREGRWLRKKSTRWGQTPDGAAVERLLASARAYAPKVCAKRGQTPDGAAVERRPEREGGCAKRGQTSLGDLVWSVAARWIEHAPDGVRHPVVYRVVCPFISSTVNAPKGVRHRLVGLWIRTGRENGCAPKGVRPLVVDSRVVDRRGLRGPVRSRTTRAVGWGPGFRRRAGSGSRTRPGPSRCRFVRGGPARREPKPRPTHLP